MSYCQSMVGWGEVGSEWQRALGGGPCVLGTVLHALVRVVGGVDGRIRGGAMESTQATIRVMNHEVI